MRMVPGAGRKNEVLLGTQPFGNASIVLSHFYAKVIGEKEMRTKEHAQLWTHSRFIKADGVASKHQPRPDEIASTSQGTFVRASDPVQPCPGGGQNVDGNCDPLCAPGRTRRNASGELFPALHVCAKMCPAGFKPHGAACAKQSLLERSECVKGSCDGEKWRNVPFKGDDAFAVVGCSTGQVYLP